MAPFPGLFGPRKPKKRGYTRHARRSPLPTRYAQIWYDEVRYRKFELIATGEGRTITAVAADIADAGFSTYLSARIAKEKQEAEERRRLGLPALPDRALNRMKRQAEKRGMIKRQGGKS